jgi:8-oxo-dGTP pyrophosphatase MutT (NUDIX family)
MTRPQVVVGAAILREGRLLAARRSSPSAVAGGWEFPGGKVEPGETEIEALRRECCEELGVRVQIGGRVGPDAQLPGGALLRVYVAALDAGREPAPLQDHDQLAWLGSGELSGVPWLPADWPIVHAVADRLATPEPLAGGRVGGAVRVGDTVRRPTGAWTPAVHALLAHARGAGLSHVPELLGTDATGREVLRYVPGRTVGDADAVDQVFRQPDLVAGVGAWLRGLHDATAGFSTEPLEWRRGRMARRSGGVICHNDLSPHNVVLDDDGRLAVVLDWDMAAPGDRRDDLAFAAWQFVLRHGEPPETEAFGLRALADGYGPPLGDPLAVLDRVGPRLRGAVRFMRRGAAAGDSGLQRLLTTGIPEATEAGVDALAGRRDALAALLR